MVESSCRFGQSQMLNGVLMKKLIILSLFLIYWGCGEEVFPPEVDYPTPVSLKPISIDSSTFTISWTMNDDIDFLKYTLYEGSSIDEQPTILGDFSNRLDTSFTLESTWNINYYRINVMDIDGLVSSSNIEPINDEFDFNSIVGLWRIDSVHTTTLEDPVGTLHPIVGVRDWFVIYEDTFIDYTQNIDADGNPVPCFYYGGLYNISINDMGGNQFELVFNNDDGSTNTYILVLINGYSMYLYSPHLDYPSFYLEREFPMSFEPECN